MKQRTLAAKEPQREEKSTFKFSEKVAICGMIRTKKIDMQGTPS